MHFGNNKPHKASYILWVALSLFFGVFISSMATNGAMTVYSYFKNGEFHKDKTIVYEYKSNAIQIFKNKIIKKNIGGASVAAFNYEDDAEFSSGKSIKANLKEMKLSLLENGQKIKEFEIMSKGKPGSPWETPSGSYRILSKEESHLSSIGLVWMPYSMQFFGNFFIHGWPINLDGTDVSEGYSGGCIRLSREDAKEVFDFASINTPIYISGGYDSPVNLSGNYYYFRSRKNDFSVNAKSYLAVDLDSGEILVSKNENTILPIASIAKLMTAIVSLEAVNQFQETTVPREAMSVPYGEVGGLKEGEKILTGDLIYPLLIESSNSAAETIARHYGRDGFIRQMNDKATAIGLANTLFTDPSGISSENTSTVIDMFNLIKHLFNNKKYVLQITQKTRHNIGQKEWKNNNPFAGLSEHLGGKTGYTNAAGQTLVSLFSLPLSEFGSRNIAIVVLGSENREADTTAIVDYLKKNVYFGVRAD